MAQGLKPPKRAPPRLPRFSSIRENPRNPRQETSIFPRVARIFADFRIRPRRRDARRERGRESISPAERPVVPTGTMTKSTPDPLLARPPKDMPVLGPSPRLVCIGPSALGAIRKLGAARRNRRRRAERLPAIPPRLHPACPVSFPRLGVRQRQQGVGRHEIRVSFEESRVGVDPRPVGSLAFGQGDQQIVPPVVLDPMSSTISLWPKAARALAKVCR